MKIARMATVKKRRFRPQAKFDFRSYDFSEFAAFLRRSAPEWLDASGLGTRNGLRRDGQEGTSK
jgi:hypothetical protein